MNPLPEFFSLLREAHDSSEAVDYFDLHSEIPASVAQWNVLLAAQQRDTLALVRYCAQYSESLEEELSR